MRFLKLAAISIVIIFISGFIFIMYEIISAQGRQDVVSKYISHVKLQVISLAAIRDNSVEIVEGYPTDKWIPTYTNQKFMCKNANKMVSDARKLGVNLVVAGAFSNPKHEVSVYGMPLALIVVDTSIFPNGEVPIDSQFSLEYARVLFRGSTEISVTWLKCGESSVAIPKLKYLRSINKFG